VTVTETVTKKFKHKEHHDGEVSVRSAPWDCCATWEVGVYLSPDCLALYPQRKKHKHDEDEVSTGVHLLNIFPPGSLGWTLDR
jgi:hypothetical protein